MPRKAYLAACLLRACLAVVCGVLGVSRQTGAEAPGTQLASGAPDLTVYGPAANPQIVTRFFSRNDCAVAEGCVQPGTRKLLVFTTESRNVGSSDLEVGDPSKSPLFHFDACHHHYHYGTFAEYRLLDATREVAVGRKNGFCLEDDLRFDPAANPSAVYDCDHQGIQTGWADVYTSSLPCQWIDITDVPAGSYTLELAMNPDRLLPESNYDNNTVEIPVRFGDRITPGTLPSRTPTPTTTATPTPRPGCVTLRPNALGAFQSQNRPSGNCTESWQCVRESDGDASYVFSGPTSGIGPRADFYGFDDVSLRAEPISTVTVHIVSRSVNPVTNGSRATTLLKVGTNPSVFRGTSFVPSDTYTDAATSYASNPVTHEPWAWPDINGLQAGVQHDVATSDEVRTTAVSLEVCSLPPTDSTATPAETAAPTLTATPSVTAMSPATVTATPSRTATATQLANPPTVAATSSPTQTLPPTDAPTATFSASDTPTRAPSDTPTERPTDTPSRTFTPSSTVTLTQTATASPTVAVTRPPTATPSPSFTLTPTVTPTEAPTLTPVPTASPSPTKTRTLTPRPTSSWTPARTPSEVPTLMPTRTASASRTPTVSFTPVPQSTHTPTVRPTAPSTSTATATATPSNTGTAPAPSPAPTNTPTTVPALPPTRTPTGAETPTVPVTPTRKATASAACGGDCDHSGYVTVDEIVTMVNVALGLAPASACPAGGGDGGGTIEIDEIVSAVLHALGGCP
ncbi:MAG: lysyl oxidase family protein [Candidatus Binatia bacterium]